MINPFTRVPGLHASPAGAERRVLRLLPKVLVVGSLLLGLPSLAVRLFVSLVPPETASLVTTVDIYAVSLLVLHWTVLFTVGIGALIVMVMKGPGYVADAYPLEDADRPRATDARARP